MDSPCSLTPRGVSGLKFLAQLDHIGANRSHPSRGEWIEMSCPMALNTRAKSLTPRGVSGLKSKSKVRGTERRQSHPSRGEWIEIGNCARRYRS